MRCEQCKHYAGLLNFVGLLIIKCDRFKIINKKLKGYTGQHQYMAVLKDGDCPETDRGFYYNFVEDK